jgi:hypothetical protein
VRLKTHALALLALAWPAQGFSYVLSIPLARLVAESDLIVVATVESVRKPFLALFGKKRAVARVIEVWKGAPGETVRFRASPGWTCDISDAVVGETVLLFLCRRVGTSTLDIAHHGRGRMPIRTLQGSDHATFWQVMIDKGTETIEGPDPRYSFIRSVSLATLKRLVETALKSNPAPAAASRPPAH